MGPSPAVTSLLFLLVSFASGDPLRLPCHPVDVESDYFVGRGVTDPVAGVVAEAERASVSAESESRVMAFVLRETLYWIYLNDVEKFELVHLELPDLVAAVTYCPRTGIASVFEIGRGLRLQIDSSVYENNMLLRQGGSTWFQLSGCAVGGGTRLPAVPTTVTTEAGIRLLHRNKVAESQRLHIVNNTTPFMPGGIAIPFSSSALSIESPRDPVIVFESDGIYYSLRLSNRERAVNVFLGSKNAVLIELGDYMNSDVYERGSRDLFNQRATHPTYFEDSTGSTWNATMSCTAGVNFRRVLTRLPSKAMFNFAAVAIFGSALRTFAVSVDNQKREVAQLTSSPKDEYFPREGGQPEEEQESGWLPWAVGLIIASIFVSVFGTLWIFLRQRKWYGPVLVFLIYCLLAVAASVGYFRFRGADSDRTVGLTVGIVGMALAILVVVVYEFLRRRFSFLARSSQINAKNGGAVPPPANDFNLGSRTQCEPTFIDVLPSAPGPPMSDTSEPEAEDLF